MNSISIDNARKSASAGRIDEAYDLIMEEVFAAEESGHYELVRGLISALDDIIPRNRLSREQLGWLLNSEGLALANHEGRREEAIERFEQMISVAQSIPDKAMESTALLNLGSQALNTGNHVSARDYFQACYEIRREIGDRYGQGQVLLNIASLGIESGHLSEVLPLLQLIRQSLGGTKTRHLLITLNGLEGNLAVRQKDFAKAEAHYRQALRYARQEDDAIGEFTSTLNIGSVNFESGRPGNALRWYRRALRIAQALHSLGQEVQVEQALGLACYQLDRQSEAAGHFRRATDLATQLGDRIRWSRMTADLGAITLNLGIKQGDVSQIGQASRLLSNALLAFREMGDREWEVRTTRNLIVASLKTGKLQEASRQLEETVTNLGDEARKQKVELLTFAASAAYRELRTESSQAKIEFAASLLESAFEEHAQLTSLDGDDIIDSDLDLAALYVEAATALSVAGDEENAIIYYSYAIDTYLKHEQEHLVARSRNDRANAFIELGKYESAVKDLDANLESAARLDDRAMAMLATLNKAELMRRIGDTSQAIELGRYALTLAQALDDRSAELMILVNLGTTFTDAENYSEARTILARANELAYELKDRATEARIHGALGNIGFRERQYDQALDDYERGAEIYRSLDAIDKALPLMGGALEVASVCGNEAQTEAIGNAIVALTPRVQDRNLSVIALNRAGGQWLKRGHYDNAVSLYASAVALSVPSPRFLESGVEPDADGLEVRTKGEEPSVDKDSPIDAADDAMFEAITKAVLGVIISAEVALGIDSPEINRIVQLTIAAVVKKNPGAEEFLNIAFDTVRTHRIEP